MIENKNDQTGQQTSNDLVQQSTQHTSDSSPDKANIKIPEIEECDKVITDQRRPQFRSGENYGRRNY